MRTWTRARCCGDIPLRWIALFDRKLAVKYQIKVWEPMTPNATYCANFNCAVFLNNDSAVDDLVTCGKCSTQTCVKCKDIAHPGQICEENEERGTLMKWQKILNGSRVLDVASSSKGQQAAGTWNTLAVRLISATSAGGFGSSASWASLVPQTYLTIKLIDILRIEDTRTDRRISPPLPAKIACGHTQLLYQPPRLRSEAHALDTLLLPNSHSRYATSEMIFWGPHHDAPGPTRLECPPSGRSVLRVTSPWKDERYGDIALYTKSHAIIKTFLAVGWVIPCLYTLKCLSCNTTLWFTFKCYLFCHQSYSHCTFSIQSYALYTSCLEHKKPATTNSSRFIRSLSALPPSVGSHNVLMVKSPSRVR